MKITEKIFVEKMDEMDMKCSRWKSKSMDKIIETIFVLQFVFCNVVVHGN